MLKFFVRYRVAVDRVLEIISFKQSKCLEKYTNFNKQKRNKPKTKFEIDFSEKVNIGFLGKTLEIIRERL